MVLKRGLGSSNCWWRLMLKEVGWDEAGDVDGGIGGIAWMGWGVLLRHFIGC